MGVKVDSSSTTSLFVCYRCGKAYSRRSSNFPSSYAQAYKGTGYLPCCSTCTDEIVSECPVRHQAAARIC